VLTRTGVLLVGGRFIASVKFRHVPSELLGGACTLGGVENIIGQKGAVDTLLQSIEGDRRHHAFIFAGPLGVGKCTTSIAFAKRLLGMGGSQQSAHPDLHIIKKEDIAWSKNPLLRKRKQTNIPLDLLRERMIGGKTSDDATHDAVAYKTPVSGREKVFIIDEAELLDEAGQNALLKTLEEPPAGTTIILVTCRDDLLLPTVRSRCQVVFFSPLDDVAMKQWASSACSDTSSDILDFAMAFSCGSPGITRDAIDSGVPELATSISAFLELSPTSDYVAAADVLHSYVSNSVEAQLKENPLASKEAANRKAAQRVFMLFGQATRSMVRGDRQEEGVVAAGILVDVERQLSTNISIKVLLESLAARWSHLCRGDAALV
jgi:DNA polymerase-3 subunit delta'